MAIVSILLSVVAFGCTVIGFFTTPIPVVGLVFSFGAAAIALGGIMLGGKATSVAKARSMPTDAARIGVILNVGAFVPALMVAFTCGVCNAVMSSGNVQVQKNFSFGSGGPSLFPGFGVDAGTFPEPAPEPSPEPKGGKRPGPGRDAGSTPSNALPPPPLPPGPRK